MTEQLYQVQEYKVWRGIDPDNATWASRGFCGSRESMDGIADYLKHNNPDLVLRVVPYQTEDNK